MPPIWFVIGGGGSGQKKALSKCAFDNVKSAASSSSLIGCWLVVRLTPMPPIVFSFLNQLKLLNFKSTYKFIEITIIMPINYHGLMNRLSIK